MSLPERQRSLSPCILIELFLALHWVHLLFIPCSVDSWSRQLINSCWFVMQFCAIMLIFSDLIMSGVWVTGFFYENKALHMSHNCWTETAMHTFFTFVFFTTLYLGLFPCYFCKIEQNNKKHVLHGWLKYSVL